jgi:hypothetical protein
MDRTAVEAIVGREIGGLMEKLGVGHWNAEVSYGSIPGDAGGVVHGQCTRMYDYETATIELDPSSLRDEAHALKTLRHELFHLVLSSYDLYASGVDNLALPKAMHDVLDRMWRHSCERAVIRLEAMYQGLTKAEEVRS